MVYSVASRLKENQLLYDIARSGVPVIENTNLATNGYTIEAAAFGSGITENWYRRVQGNVTGCIVSLLHSR